MKQRITQLEKWLQEQDISFALISSTPNLFYLSNFYTTPHERLVALGVFPEGEPFLVCPKMELTNAKRAGWDYELIGYSDTDHPWDLIQRAVQKRCSSIHSIAIEKQHLTFERGEQLKILFQHAEIKGVEQIVNKLRLIKDETEISILREAAKLADFGVEVGVHALSEGKTELEIIAAIEYELKKKGVRQMSFSTMVLTGVKTALPHGAPSLDQIQKGDLVLFDLGVIVDGYCSDITRTIAYYDINDKQREIYETVHKAQLAAIAVSKLGTEIGRLDQVAREIITEAGYGEFFTHRIGHGLGIDVHEFPSMNATNKDRLQAGMTFTIEPGIYVPDLGGVRIEDDLLITDNGVDVLTKYPKELQIVKS